VTFRPPEAQQGTLLGKTRLRAAVTFGFATSRQAVEAD
jgi:hypothetical protein